eukprot:6517433-Alexandrium_andersonii.AAC.1
MCLRAAHEQTDMSHRSARRVFANGARACSRERATNRICERTGTLSPGRRCPSPPPEGRRSRAHT